MRYYNNLMNDNRITILALSWRDIKSPTAGGAEVHTHEMLKRINHSKFRIIHFAAMYDGLKEVETIDGIQYLRKGNIISVIWYAFNYYKKNIKNIDIVLEQCNTHRFFTPFWVEHKKRIFYIHQLTREIWDINLKFPLNKLGKLFENMMLRINRKDYTIALSPSTKQDLLNVGFEDEKIQIIPVGMNFNPWKEEDMYPKEKEATFIYVGRYAKYKGIDMAIEAFGRLKKEFLDAKLWILGKKDEDYVKDKLIPVCKKYQLIWSDSVKNGDIISWGFVTEDKKLELLSRATALLFPSIREGWGIPITEAAIVGTPSIVFDSPGIRDAINMGQAGYLCRVNKVDGLLEQMQLVVKDTELYNKTRKCAYEFSSQFLWENSENLLEEFIISIINKEH